ncbi:MAG: helix-turn-helix domain-containing protein [Undibacterium sp.]|nr:helix-turn-helix domain-containing protein [Undibacterium sp.]MDO8651873.1 helix-turn-helix domain-containing protein [Undibacterium sp.]
MKKIPKQSCTTEFKELAVKRAVEMRSIPAAAKELRLSYQTLRN